MLNCPAGVVHVQVAATAHNHDSSKGQHDRLPGSVEALHLPNECAPSPFRHDAANPTLQSHQHRPT